jgi:hypothetical protein
MSSIKQLISNAVHKLYTIGKRYDDADDFCVDLFKLLDNEDVSVEEEPVPQAAEIPVVKEVKVKAPKVSKEEKEAAKAAKEAEKAAAEAAKAAKEAEKAAAKAAKVKPAKVKAEVNIEKLNPTQTKLFKKVLEGKDSDENKKAFLEQMNALSSDEYNSKKMEDHMKSFLAGLVPEAEPEAETEELECDVVEFKGKEYSVSADGTVYDEIDGAYKKVGMVGMADFADMKIPPE